MESSKTGGGLAWNRSEMSSRNTSSRASKSDHNNPRTWGLSELMCAECRRQRKSASRKRRAFVGRELLFFLVIFRPGRAKALRPDDPVGAPSESHSRSPAGSRDYD